MKLLFNPFTGTFDWVSEEDLSGYVPYSGALGDVDLGEYSLIAAFFKTEEFTLTLDDNFVVSTQLSAIGANTTARHSEAHNIESHPDTVVTGLQLNNILSQVGTNTAELVTHGTAISLNTAKDTNVPTELSLGTINATTLAITSDGGANDVTLPEADIDNAGLLSAVKWNEIVANTLKVAESTSVTSPLVLIDYDISIPIATSEVNGYLSSANWITFNNKSNLALGETEFTAYRGDKGKIAYDHSQNNHQAHTDYLLNTGDTASGDYNFDSNTFVIRASTHKVGIGIATPLSSLDVGGSFGTNVTHTTKNIVLDRNHNVILVTPDRDAIAVVLPPLIDAVGRWYLIKKLGDTEYPVVIVAHEEEQIEGGNQFELYNMYDSVLIVASNEAKEGATGWYIMSSHGI